MDTGLWGEAAWAQTPLGLAAAWTCPQSGAGSLRTWMLMAKSLEHEKPFSLLPEALGRPSS